MKYKATSRICRICNGLIIHPKSIKRGVCNKCFDMLWFQALSKLENDLNDTEHDLMRAYKLIHELNRECAQLRDYIKQNANDKC